MGLREKSEKAKVKRQKGSFKRRLCFCGVPVSVPEFSYWLIRKLGPVSLRCPHFGEQARASVFLVPIPRGFSGFLAESGF